MQQRWQFALASSLLELPQVQVAVLPSGAAKPTLPELFPVSFLEGDKTASAKSVSQASDRNAKVVLRSW